LIIYKIANKKQEKYHRFTKLLINLEIQQRHLSRLNSLSMINRDSNPN